jgi:hypothetical protein
LKVWIGNNPPFLDEELSKDVRVDESYWMVEGDELQVILGKVLKADLWTCVFKSRRILIFKFILCYLGFV